MGSGIYYVLNDSYLLADLISSYFYHLLYELSHSTSKPPYTPWLLGKMSDARPQ